MNVLLKKSLSQTEKMQQRGDGGETAPAANGETVCEMNSAPLAFSLNRSSVLCLPVVSDSHKLLWVHSSQFDLQLDGAAELDKAFDRFPYLTQKQTAALAQRCSLHPDQVRVWFMAQRLRYGISWDYKDISKVRRKFNRRKEELRYKTGEEVKTDRGENTQREREVEVSDGEAGEVIDEHGANEWRIWGGNVENKQQNKSRKRKWRTLKLGRTRTKQADEAVLEGAEIKSDEDEREWQGSPPSETTLCTRKKKKTDKILLSAMSPVKSGSERETETRARLEGLQSNSTSSGAAVAYVSKIMEVSGDPGVEKGSPTFTQQQDSHTVDASPPPPQIRFRRTTAAQMVKMRGAFLQCQYPDRDDYNQLARETGVRRRSLVQWFSDMRYYVKRGKPRWLNQEQHRQILANVMYQQCLNEMAKLKPMSKVD